MEKDVVIDANRIHSVSHMADDIRYHTNELQRLMMIGEAVDLSYMRALCAAAKNEPHEFLLRVVTYVENHLAGGSLLDDEEVIHQYVLSFKLNIS